VTTDTLPAQASGARNLWLAVTVSIAVAAFAEAVFAGAMMSGAPWGRAAHRLTALALPVVTAIAGFAAFARLRRAAGGSRFALTLLALAVLLVIQMAAGAASAHGARLLWLHIPLGVALVGVAFQSVAQARRLQV
jgi:hypothetical protein